MKKDIEWLKNEVNELPLRFLGFSMLKQREEFTVSKDDVLELIDQLDEPEVLSQEWIDEHRESTFDLDLDEDFETVFIKVEDLQNLLVPKQEEVDRAYKDGYEKGKQHTFYKGYLEGLAEGERKTNEYFESITEEPSYEQVQKYLSEHGIEVVEKEPETVADVIADFYKSLERLKEVMSMGVEEPKQ